MAERLVAQPLTREAFTPFGDVLQTEGAQHFPINDGTTERYHALAAISLDAPPARGIISIFRGRPCTPPVRLSLMERHPLGSQAFMPLDRRPYLVVVAPPAVSFVRGDLRAFLARGDQGVSYAPNVWHHPLLALQEVSDFLVVDRDGPGENCERRPLPGPVEVTLPPAPGPAADHDVEGNP